MTRYPLRNPKSKVTSPHKVGSEEGQRRPVTQEDGSGLEDGSDVKRTVLRQRTKVLDEEGRLGNNPKGR